MDSRGWERALQVLAPLNSQLDAALAAGDEQAALRLAFQGASEAARLIAGPSCLEPTVHRVYVELTPLHLASYDDGTLAEHNAYVSLAYQGWQMAEEAAEQLADEMLACVNGIGSRWAVDSP